MTGTLSQLAFDLGHRPAHGREDFLVAPSNAEAVGWLDRWPDWPAPALTIYGPTGCGKSHLAQVWRARSGAVSFDRAALRVASLADRLGPARAAIVEDGDLDGDEEVLLHLYNVLAERRGYLLLTARTAPSRWPLRLADWRSRVVAAPAVAVAAPDDTLLAGLLVKLFADRQVRVSAELIAFAVARMERSFEAAHALVNALDKAALAAARPITVPLARTVFDELERRKSI